MATIESVRKVTLWQRLWKNPLLQPASGNWTEGIRPNPSVPIAVPQEARFSACVMARKEFVGQQSLRPLYLVPDDIRTTVPCIGH
jgi:hypothetical protein